MKLDEDTFKAAKSLRDRLQNLLEKSDSEDGEPDTSFKNGGNRRPDSFMSLLKLDNAYRMISEAEQLPHWDREPTQEMIIQKLKFLDETEKTAQAALDEIIAVLVDWVVIPYSPPPGEYMDPFEYDPIFTKLILKSHQVGKASEMFAYRKLLDLSLHEAMALYEKDCPILLASIIDSPEEKLKIMYHQAKELGLDVDLQ